VKVYRLPAEAGLSTQKVTVLATVSITGSYELVFHFVRKRNAYLLDVPKESLDAPGQTSKGTVEYVDES
jgi:hypothetical protein